MTRNRSTWCAGLSKTAEAPVVGLPDLAAGSRPEEGEPEILAEGTRRTRTLREFFRSEVCLIAAKLAQVGKRSVMAGGEFVQKPERFAHRFGRDSAVFDKPAHQVERFRVMHYGEV